LGENRFLRLGGAVAGGPRVDPEYEWLFDAEFQHVVRAVFLIVHDAELAEDLTQEAFIRLLQQWRRVSRYDRPGAWVRRVALNLALNAERRRAIGDRVMRRLPPPALPQEVDIDLMRAIASLPFAQRAAVALHYLEDRAAAEIADLLGCAESTARVHLSRGRRRLAELLDEEVSDADR
jgi:RNA polymerase sigma-70 factor (ECF subfamily)